MKRDTNGHDHAFDIAENIDILEVYYAITGPIQETVAINVSVRCDVMRMAIQFHDQIMLATKKVGEERSDRHLPTEFCPELRA